MSTARHADTEHVQHLRNACVPTPTYDYHDRAHRTLVRIFHSYDEPGVSLISTWNLVDDTNTTTRIPTALLIEEVR